MLGSSPPPPPLFHSRLFFFFLFSRGPQGKVGTRLLASQRTRSWSSGYDCRLPSDRPGFNSRRAHTFFLAFFVVVFFFFAQRRATKKVLGAFLVRLRVLLLVCFVLFFLDFFFELARVLRPKAPPPPKKSVKNVENQGIDPCASRMLSVRSTI